MIRPHQLVWVIGLGFLLGVGLGGRLVLPVGYLLLAAGLLMIAVVFCFYIPSRIIGLFLVASLIGWWRCEAVLQARPDVSYLNGHTGTVTGLVVSDPEITSNQQRLQLLITTIDEQPIHLKLLLTSWHLPEFKYADQLSGQVKLSLPQDSAEFQYSHYLAKDNIYLTAQQAGNLTVTHPTKPTFLGTLYCIKHWVNSAIHRFLPEPHASLLSGLLLGVKSDLSESFKTALKNSGTSHIVALSGFNVTIIIIFLLSLLSRLPRRWVWLISGLLILIFIIMTGATSSVVRAAIMGWLLLLASFWGRKRDPINAVLLAIVMMVALHPLILFYDVGFQLSVAATLGLVYCTPLMNWRSKFLPRVVIEAMAATIGATLFTLPLIALYFGGLSLVSLGANILVVPLVPYVMLVGFVGFIGFTIWPSLQWLAIFVWPLSSLLMSIINWFGHLPIAFLTLPPLPTWIPLLYYISLLLSIVYVRQRRHSQKLV